MKVKVLALGLSVAMLATGCSSPKGEGRFQWLKNRLANDGGYTAATRDAFVLKPPAAKEDKQNLLHNEPLQSYAPTETTVPETTTEDAAEELMTAPQEGDDLMSAEPMEDAIPNMEPVGLKPMPKPTSDIGVGGVVEGTVPHYDSMESNTSQQPGRTFPQEWTKPLQLDKAGQADVEEPYAPITTPVQQPEQPEPFFPNPSLMRGPEVETQQHSGTNYSSGSVTVFSLDNETELAVPTYAEPQYGHSVDNSHSGVTVHHYDDIFGDAPNYQPITTYDARGIPSQAKPQMVLATPTNAIYFKHGSAALSNADKQMIKDFIASVEGQSVTVIGHSSKPVHVTEDPVQKGIVNLKMSAKRAETVAEALLRAGLTPSRVETVAKGDAASMDQETKDRRVEIFVR